MPWPKILPAAVLLCLVAGCGGPRAPVAVPSVTAANLSPLLGLPFGTAIDQVEALGYERVRGRGSGSYWSEPRSGRCARLGRGRGRLTSVMMLPRDEC
ncbi:hypothetical protein [Mangrovicoccus algicola]|uniref:PASTA domain-containing protein n=1 Tax=Mangrovicoccus algicola TaxID=2771008 RepID=A0A8J6ZDD0_9RHOB|nr:hypothetical protein [Mangrovicoccus algicola]MBE3640016.1 hypothetical protein [Mangrovicoccus algicola]